MGRRIGFWALAGAAVGLLWVVYFYVHNYSAYHGGPPLTYSAVTTMLVNITIPIGFLFGRHHAITWYWSVVLNAGIYAGVGLTLEMIRMALRAGKPARA